MNTWSVSPTVLDWSNLFDFNKIQNYPEKSPQYIYKKVTDGVYNSGNWYEEKNNPPQNIWNGTNSNIYYPISSNGNSITIYNEIDSITGQKIVDGKYKEGKISDFIPELANKRAKELEKELQELKKAINPNPSTPYPIHKNPWQWSKDDYVWYSSDTVSQMSNEVAK